MYIYVTKLTNFFFFEFSHVSVCIIADIAIDINAESQNAFSDG
jgi:hypothetical protein